MEPPRAPCRCLSSAWVSGNIHSAVVCYQVRHRMLCIWARRPPAKLQLVVTSQLPPLPAQATYREVFCQHFASLAELLPGGSGYHHTPCVRWPAHLLHGLHAVLEVARLLAVHVLQPAQRLGAPPLRRLRPLGRPACILSLQRGPSFRAALEVSLSDALMHPTVPLRRLRPLSRSARIFSLQGSPSYQGNSKVSALQMRQYTCRLSDASALQGSQSFQGVLNRSTLQPSCYISHINLFLPCQLLCQHPQPAVKSLFPTYILT